MKRIRKLLAFAILGIMAIQACLAEGETDMELARSYKKQGENNPLYTQRFGADPGVMVYDGRVYVFMTNDIPEYDASGNVKENSYSQIRSISLISSDDLVNWTDHGLIPAAGKNGIAKWANNSWAPCAAHKTVDGEEKFFLYFCNGGNGIGVLTAPSPTGPWKDELGHALVSRITPNCRDIVWLFDPAVMVDEDGTGYLAFGGGVPAGKEAEPGTARIVRLAEDMLSLDGVPQVIDAPYLFEDSGINRIGDKYVYSYCSNWQTTGNTLRLTSGAIEYMTADDPLGPYTYEGELFPNQGRFFGLYGNNHHSIASFGGELLLFYHNRPVEKAMGISGNYRSPQVDRITVSASGKMSVKGTMKGISQIKAFDPFRSVSACEMARQAGISCDGKQVTDIDTGDWTQLCGVDFAAGTKDIRLFAETQEKLVIRMYLDNTAGAPLFEAVFDEEKSECVMPAQITGVHDMYFVFEGSGSFIGWEAR